jgi:hypothetical protein
MGAREHPTAGHGIDGQHFRVKSFNQGLDLCVMQLAHIVLSATDSAHPSEENVRCYAFWSRLHGRLLKNCTFRAAFPLRASSMIVQFLKLLCAHSVSYPFIEVLRTHNRFYAGDSHIVSDSIAYAGESKVDASFL